METRGVKLGLFLPVARHDRMIAAGRAGRSAGYAGAFAAARGRNKRVTVRIHGALCDRLRAQRATLGLKITDVACAAVDRFLSTQRGA